MWLNKMVGGACILNQAGPLNIALQIEAKAAQDGRTTSGMSAYRTPQIFSPVKQPEKLYININNHLKSLEIVQYAYNKWKNIIIQ